MGGFFGVASKQDCVLELFYGVDYHSHLGTRRGGMAVYGEDGFYRAIHNIENSPFRTKFDHDVSEMKGYLGIGCISDYDPQPLLIQSHLGSFAITTVGKVNNYEELLKGLFEKDHSHFQEMTNRAAQCDRGLWRLLICEKRIHSRRNQICTGRCRWFYDDACHDKRRNLWCKGQVWANTSCDR